MKKIAIVLLGIFITGMVLSGCKSNERCAAYDEAKKFQKESRR